MSSNIQSTYNTGDVISLSGVVGIALPEGSSVRMLTLHGRTCSTNYENVVPVSKEELTVGEDYILKATINTYCIRNNVKPIKLKYLK